jgi:hypothetical protein
MHVLQQGRLEEGARGVSGFKRAFGAVTLGNLCKTEVCGQSLEQDCRAGGQGTFFGGSSHSIQAFWPKVELESFKIV